MRADRADDRRIDLIALEVSCHPEERSDEGPAFPLELRRRAIPLFRQ